MTSTHFLVVVALAQGVLLFGLSILILLNRWFRIRRSSRIHPLKLALDATMQRWTAGSEQIWAVVLGLERLPVPVAIDALVSWSARVSGARWQELAYALERERWTRLIRGNSTSHRWWKRLECARFLSVAATDDDVPWIRTLLQDPHPAVHVAAVGALERIESAALVTLALERMRHLAPTVQAYYAAMLKRSRPVVVGLLRRKLERVDDPALAHLVEFAARLEEPALRERLTALARHPDSEVRTQVARGLASFPHAQSVAALTELARDEVWEVRAQAVRSLGMIADLGSLPLLRAALRDPVWWVRLRAGVALTRLGPPGRNTLLAAEVGPHAGARDVARMLLGLSPQALAEFAR